MGRQSVRAVEFRTINARDALEVEGGFLSSREYAVDNGRSHREVLGSHTAAATVLIAGIYDEAWQLEIGAIAAR